MLQNSTNKPLTAQISAKDFTSSEALNGEPRLLETPNQKYGLSNWLSDSNIQKSLTIPAKQTIEYRALFKVPVSAQPRTYFGSVIFTYTSDDGQPISIGSLVFITIGNPKAVLSFENLNYSESELATEPYGVIDTIINNSGEGLASPIFRLKITGDNGRVIDEITDESAGSILPESSRRYSFAPSKPLPSEHLTFTLSATDQHGNTIDKSLQLDLSKIPETITAKETNDSDKTRSLFLPLILGFLILVSAVGALLAYRHRKTTQATLPADSSENKTPNENLDDSDDNISN